MSAREADRQAAQSVGAVDGIEARLALSEQGQEEPSAKDREREARISGNLLRLLVQLSELASCRGR